MNFLLLKATNQDREVEHSISELVVAPEVEALSEGLDVLLSALFLNRSRVEEPLGRTDDLALSLFLLGNKLHASVSFLILDLLHARDKSHDGLFVCLDLLYQSKVSSVDTALDSHPLMLLEGSLTNFRTYLEHLGHISVGNHLNASLVNSGYSIDDC